MWLQVPGIRHPFAAVYRREAIDGVQSALRAAHPEYAAQDWQMTTLCRLDSFMASEFVPLPNPVAIENVPKSSRSLTFDCDAEGPASKLGLVSPRETVPHGYRIDLTTNQQVDPSDF